MKIPWGWRSEMQVEYLMDAVYGNRGYLVTPNAVKDMEYRKIVEGEPAVKLIHSNRLFDVCGKMGA